MINGQPSAGVFVDEDKSRTRHLGWTFHTANETLYELCFACAQIAGESKNVSGARLAGITGAGSHSLLNALGNEHSRGGIFDLESPASSVPRTALRRFSIFDCSVAQFASAEPKETLCASEIGAISIHLAKWRREVRSLRHQRSPRRWCSHDCAGA